MKVAVVQFPGSNCDLDTVHVLKNIMHIDTDLVWHAFFKDSKYNAAVLPGGFSYGDHLRAGIIAAYNPAMQIVKDMAKEGKPILGICNGFQTLIEAELLPGALLQNDCLTFVCKWVYLRTESSNSVFTNEIKKGTVIRIPVAHGEGRYFNDEKSLKELNENDQIIFRYSDKNGEITPQSNPNGAFENIAGICNLERNVVGMMPHPERASEPIISPYRSRDGTGIFQSLKQFLGGY
ncbi:MAG: phosphoribosylformylglycinamidine synthase I [Candidatus Helarchaeota archaeon]|nr:phosphoribosylformylglycinamidine synthase I [Candidatus Helarchaeota archaeon]